MMLAKTKRRQKIEGHGGNQIVVRRWTNKRTIMRITWLKFQAKVVREKVSPELLGHTAGAGLFTSAAPGFSRNPFDSSTPIKLTIFSPAFLVRERAQILAVQSITCPSHVTLRNRQSVKSPSDLGLFDSTVCEFVRIGLEVE